MKERIMPQKSLDILQQELYDALREYRQLIYEYGWDSSQVQTARQQVNIAENSLKYPQFA